MRRKLDELFARAGRLDEADELTGDLGQYLCVRVSGYLEQALSSCGRSVCERLSWAEGQSFSLSWLNRTPNPRADEVEKFVRRFSDKWADELSLMLAENERGQRLNALLGLRNDIAHGKNQGVSTRRAHDYLTVVDEVIDFLLDRFEPQP